MSITTDINIIFSLVITLRVFHFFSKKYLYEHLYLLIFRDFSIFFSLRNEINERYIFLPLRLRAISKLNYTPKQLRPFIVSLPISID